MTFFLTEQIIGIAALQKSAESGMESTSCTALQIAKIKHTKKVCYIAALDEVQTFPVKSKARIASVCNATKTLIRTLDIPLVKQKDVDAAFSFELEPLLPYPIETCVYDKLVLEQDAAHTKLCAFAIEKAEIVSHLQMLQQWNKNESASQVETEPSSTENNSQKNEKESVDDSSFIDSEFLSPERIIPKACALSHFCKLFFPTTTSEEPNYQIVIDIDDSETTCLLVYQGKPLAARSHPAGAAVLPDTHDLSETALTTLHSYLRELARILLSFDQLTNNSDLPILFTGKAACNPNHETLIASFLERKTLSEAIHTVTFAEGITWNKAKTFATAIGAALSFGLSAESINFRSDAFCPVGFSKRYNRVFAGYFAAMTALALSCYFLGNTHLANEKIALIEKYSQLLVLQDKPIPENITEVTCQEIDDALFANQEQLQSPAANMALHPDVPRVSDLLIWLSENKQEIQLESLNYVLVKRPDKEKPKERYQVRVDLEFSSASPTLAREFHDVLLAPNPFIDPKFELKWSVQKGRYRASFFLKDRTQYPHTVVAEGFNAKD